MRTYLFACVRLFDVNDARISAPVCRNDEDQKKFVASRPDMPTEVANGEDENRSELYKQVQELAVLNSTWNRV